MTVLPMLIVLTLRNHSLVAAEMTLWMNPQMFPSDLEEYVDRLWWTNADSESMTAIRMLIVKIYLRDTLASAVLASWMNLLIASVILVASVCRDQHHLHLNAESMVPINAKDISMRYELGIQLKIKTLGLPTGKRCTQVYVSIQLPT